MQIEITYFKKGSTKEKQNPIQNIIKQLIQLILEHHYIKSSFIIYISTHEVARLCVSNEGQSIKLSKEMQCKI